ncbi:hypothetical protein [[Eubacterium] cellulosolvens]
MSSVASPWGLRPAWHPSGVIRQALGTIASGYATTIYQFSPVQIAATGELNAAAAGARAVGVFLGVEWTGTDGRRRLSNQWEASTAGTDIVAYYTFDPDLVYEIQANASVAIAGMGQQYDWSALAGSAVTGLSSVSLDVASAAANAGLRVVGLNPGPDNAWGDSFPLVQVQIAEHQYRADVASV